MLSQEQRKTFAAHLTLCRSCSAALEDLREDERLAAAPLAPTEQTQVRKIVTSVREQFRLYLEWAFGAPSPRPRGPKQGRGRPVFSILVVEDDPDYNALLHEAFVEAGFPTQQADNGRKAFDLLRETPVDLVVSDFILPELDGLELCRLVHDEAQLSKVKVVVYSGHPYAGLSQDARASGALDYLPKTADTQAMVEQICELAGIGQQAAEADPPPRWAH
ncbi:MAG TPA: response regulator [Bryobacterales bacterium]|nr:response regulator [Bryobacterales bacterium]